MALGTSATRLYKHRETDNPWHVPPSLHRSYCPLCWNDELAKGRPLRMLRSWAGVLRTRCAIHNFPLSYAPPDWATNEQRMHYPVADLTPRDWTILELIETFGTSLEKCLLRQSTWPNDWCETPDAARRFLILANFSTSSQKDFSPTNGILPDGDLLAIVFGNRFRQEPCKVISWEPFRCMANPAERRAALWLTAWEFMPGLARELGPEGYSSPPSGRRSYVDRVRARYAI